MHNFVYKIRSTLPGKLSLWYFCSIGFAFLLFTLAVSLLLRFTIRGQIDHHLHIAINEAKQIVENYSGAEREALVKNLVSAQGMTIVVLSPDGAPILETNSPDISLMTEHQLQKIILSKTLYDSSPTHFTANEIRFAVVPAQVRAGKGVVAVGYSTKILYSSYSRLLAIFGASLVLLVLPATLLGNKLILSLINPLEQIANQAKSISLDLLSQGIHTGSSSQELIDIELALNTMLSKLGHIFLSEREFFSDAAHTLKTPLARLRIQIESTALSAKLKQGFLNTIDDANSTIQDLLYLSQIDKSKPNISRVDVSTMMANLSELASDLGQINNISVNSDLTKGIYLQADVRMLLRALSNIIQNAVHYNKKNGSIKLALHLHDEHVHITIQDTGLGIAKADIAHVFDRFYRAKNMSINGSGLGLAIAKAAIESQGGEIILSSVIGRGTIVTVIF